MVELIAPGDGRFVAGPVIVDYHVGSRRCRVVEHTYGLVCVPLHSYHTCSIPDWVVAEQPPPSG